ncbi:MAG: molybdopterin-binding/glycosyltransferase family 2 protein [Pseudomonadota bacterium]
MKFGSFPLDETIGGILAHSQRLPDDSVLRKGTVLTEELVDVMHAASMTEVMVALPEEGDVSEDEAAKRIADLFKSISVRTDQARTGRVNFFATCNGVFRVSREVVDRINAVDPGITFATLHDYTEVNEGRMVATVKIIPYYVPSRSLEVIEAIVAPAAISVSQYNANKVGLIFTLLPGTKHSILQKTRKVLEQRLALSGSKIVDELQVFHLQDDVADAISGMLPKCDMLILFGASAISDIHDVIPSAIETAGGKNIRFGMPVDPGNLMLLSEIQDKPVIGAPGCARSPAENGFDWVLQRFLAGVAVTSKDIAGMGTGGLLMETGARPHPRQKSLMKTTRTTAVILAAGQSRRMGETNKMVVDFQGKPMVRHAVEAAIASKCDDVIVVTGFEPDSVHEALAGLECKMAHNAGFAEGLSTSLKTGIANVSSDFSAAVVLLGDMPFVTAQDINKLIDEADKNSSHIIMATSNGKRGNPVLWPSSFFSELKDIKGDVGARHIIGANAEAVIEVELGDVASIDIDTPAALQGHATPQASKMD